MRTFEYRLYPNKEQSRLLMGCLAESRKLYNEMLQEMKQQYEQDGTFPTKYDLTARFKSRGGEHVPATTVQMLADRLTKSRKRYLAAKELGIPNVGSHVSRSPIAGTPSNSDSTGQAVMCGWMLITSMCMSLLNWVSCSRSSCIAPLRVPLRRFAWCIVPMGI